MKKKVLSTCLIVLVAFKSLASSDIPVSPGLVDPPPETASIDFFLPTAIAIALIMAAYYINKSTSAILNNK